MSAPTIDEQIAEVEREIAMRNRVYERWIAGGRLSRAQADRQFERMVAVLKTLETVRRLEQLW